MRRLAIALCLLLALLASGCGEDPPPGSWIRWTQPLGMRVEVQGDPDRASPAPSETVDITITQAYPAEHVPLSWAFLACEPAPVNFGIPFCVDIPVLLGSELTPVLGAPMFTLSVPTAVELDGLEEILIIGVQCAEGEIEIPDLSVVDPTTINTEALANPCLDPEGEGTSMGGTVRIETATFTNQNPAFDRIELAGTLLDDVAPPDAGEDDCTGLGIRIIDVSGTNGLLPFTLSATAGSREDYIVETGDPPEQSIRTEDLRITHTTTGAQFQRTFSSIDDTSPFIDVDWTLPTDDIPDNGRLVRFYFEMRDLRGGYDFEERAVCVVP